MQSSCLAVLCVGACRIARVVLILRGIRYFAHVPFDVCFARTASFARRHHFTPHALLCCVLCSRRVVLRFDVLRVALYVVWYRRSVLYVWRLTPHLASSFEILHEVPCALFDAFVRHPRLKRFASAIKLGSLASALTYASLCVFCRTCATQRPMGAVKF
ncbi:hypothetical protein [uncultured Campylobacter sp.]|uniref:hypothetical protein n=1 Tax=uncultured Campylobacter sp. TaxID=218934 RepID=UPI002613170B|nr:hypothetical protein [uncultured Campylobacter sp.]